jgi:hypothetical protein
MPETQTRWAVREPQSGILADAAPAAKGELAALFSAILSFARYTHVQWRCC